MFISAIIITFYIIWPNLSDKIFCTKKDPVGTSIHKLASQNRPLVSFSLYVHIYNQQYQFVFNLFLSIFRPVRDSVCPGPVGGHWWWENSGGCQRSQARRKIKQFRGAIINRRNSPLGPSISTGSCSQKKPKGTKPIFQAQWSKINNSICKFSYYRDHNQTFPFSNFKLKANTVEKKGLPTVFMNFSVFFIYGNSSILAIVLVNWGPAIRTWLFKNESYILLIFRLQNWHWFSTKISKWNSKFCIIVARIRRRSEAMATKLGPSFHTEPPTSFTFANDTGNLQIYTIYI